MEWLKTKPYPVIDMRDVFGQEFRQSKADIKTFLAASITATTHRGNFFTAWAIKDRVAKWLDPTLLPYRR